MAPCEGNMSTVYHSGKNYDDYNKSSDSLASLHRQKMVLMLEVS
jgi:hypothetical protein